MFSESFDLSETKALVARGRALQGAAVRGAFRDLFLRVPALWGRQLVTTFLHSSVALRSLGHGHTQGCAANHPS